MVIGVRKGGVYMWWGIHVVVCGHLLGQLQAVGEEEGVEEGGEEGEGEEVSPYTPNHSNRLSTRAAMANNIAMVIKNVITSV